MSKKLFLGSLAMTVALPVIVVPVQAQEFRTEVSQDFKDVPKTHSAYKEIMAMREQGDVQRDLYSAFLIMNTADNLCEINRNRTEATWSHFFAQHQQEIARIKQLDKKQLRSIAL